MGITTGLAYIYLTTQATPSGSIEQFNGSEIIDDDIPENFPKPYENMLLTTHNHVSTFAIINLLIGIIFYFNSIVMGKLKTFLLLEPFISTILTFGQTIELFEKICSEVFIVDKDHEISELNNVLAQ